jgi:hypothetical protein
MDYKCGLEIWKRLTKKTVQQLGDEWKESLR